ncbi:MAG: hypothetical protein MZV70_63675 [Desulfobacterales bacterium]|nr:hypothetical protein [Desulfobacterales bacterium]
MVVLGEPALAPAAHQLARTRGLVIGKRRTDQFLQPRGAPGVVVDAEIVHHHRQRRFTAAAGLDRSAGSRLRRRETAAHAAPQTPAPAPCPASPPAGHRIQPRQQPARTKENLRAEQHRQPRNAPDHPA